jgi:hypothetical protein
MLTSSANTGKRAESTSTTTIVSVGWCVAPTETPGAHTVEEMRLKMLLPSNPPRDPTYQEVIALVGDPSLWVPITDSQARFSRHHFHGNPADALPFDPNAYLWSPIAIRIPVVARPSRIGYYRRGVTKYVAAIKAKRPIDAVVFLWQNDRWSLQDGNHRYEAHVRAGERLILAIFALPKQL